MSLRGLHSLLLPLLFVCGSVTAQQAPSGNLALTARATVSSAEEGTRAENLNDGDIAHTQWNAKDGSSPAESWAQLDWAAPVTFQEVVIRQDGDPKLKHVNLEIRDVAGHWQVLKSIGDSEHLLSRLILAQFPEQKATALRLSSFAGHISINEVEVYDRNDPPVIVFGSDLLNHIFGVVTDGFGTLPFANVTVNLQGTAGGQPWHAAAVTDAGGLFQVDIPVGLEGKVTASAEVSKGRSASTMMHAGDLSPGLSLSDTNASLVDLGGIWRFQPDPDSNFVQSDRPDRDWKEIHVPSHWMMEGFDTRTGAGGYRRHFQIPASFRGRRIKLLFEGVYSGAEVWVNGQRIGSHEGGFAPFELDITEAAHIGADNLLAVLVREDTISSHLDDMSHYANFPLAGIFRPVRVFSLPLLHIRRFHVQTAFDSDYKNASLMLDLSVENESGQPVKNASVNFALEDPEGNRIPLANDHIDISLPAWSRLEQRIHFEVTSPEHWEAEHPQLYRLIARVASADAGNESVSRRVGFRQVEIRGTEFLINGIPVKLRGTGYFEATPLGGRVVTPDLLRRDLQMMKDANLDAFRTEVVLPLEDLYDDADEMGFYVEAESPFCWVDESSDLRYLPVFVQRTAEILDRDRSHPSVIIWSVGNESSWGPDFEAAHQFVKKHDLTRPTSAGQSATLELDTMHNPISLVRMKEREDVTVPILWDESFCVFQGRLWGDTRETWLDPGDRDYYISPLIEIWDAVQKSKNVQGSMIWAWVDDIFLVPGRDSEYGRGGIGKPEHPLDGIYHMPGRGIVGDAPWGLVDGWRRKKPEFWHIKMLMSPVHMQQRDLVGWKPGDAITFTVDNRYEFTNLSELTLEWSIGAQHGILHPDVPPRHSGLVSIPFDSHVKVGDVLSLRFMEHEGRLVLPHRMQLGVAVLPTSESPKPSPLRYLHEPYWLGGPMERFVGDNFEITFDGSNGRIRRALVNRHSVLYGTPKLHILPIQSTLSEFPAYETWRLTKPIDIHPVGDDYEITETGAYRDFAGEMRYRVTPQGSLRVSYDFTYTGTDTRAREIGLQFGVPLWCDKLQWRRIGEWTVYPDDHIGRNDGSAMAHSSVAQTVPPTQTYALDDTPIGTNDFRSTKRNFVFALLSDKEGYGVGMEAVGAQHLRASVDTDVIEVNVNDWFGGVAATAWGEWWQNYGQGRELRSDDPNEGISHNKVSGSMQLYLLGPENSAIWLHRMQTTPTTAELQQ